MQSCQNLFVFSSRVFSVLGSFQMFSEIFFRKVKVMNVGVVKTCGCVCTQRVERIRSGHASCLGCGMNQVFSHSSQTSCPAPAESLAMLFSKNELMLLSIANHIADHALPYVKRDITNAFRIPLGLIWVLTVCFSLFNKPAFCTRNWPKPSIIRGCSLTCVLWKKTTEGKKQILCVPQVH